MVAIRRPTGMSPDRFPAARIGIDNARSFVDMSNINDFIAHATRSTAAISASLASDRSRRSRFPIRAKSSLIDARPRSSIAMNGVSSASEPSGHSPIAAFRFRRISTSRPGIVRNGTPRGPDMRSAPVIWSTWQALQVSSNGLIAMSRRLGPNSWQSAQLPGGFRAGSFLASVFGK